MYTVETTKELDNMQFRFTGFKNHSYLFQFYELFLQGHWIPAKRKIHC